MRKGMTSILLGLAVPLFFLGCGGGAGGGVDTADVSGTITMDGKPLADAEVTFITEDFASSGTTDKDGNYFLPSGAAIGENKVFISKWKGGRKPGDESDELEDNPDILDDGQLEAIGDGTDASSEIEQLIPETYSDPSTTSLKFPVSAGGTKKANFRLKSN